MNPNPSIGAILLAAGASSRMGRPKQLLKFQGQSLVRRSAIAAIEADCRPVIVVTGSSSEPVMQELQGLAALPIFHAGWSAGMGSSLRAGLAAIQSEEPNLAAVVILVCDQPYMNEQVIRRLIEAWKNDRTSMFASAYTQTFGPPCCFGCDKFPDLASLPDSQGAKAVLSADPENLTLLPWPEGAVDWDLPEHIKT